MNLQPLSPIIGAEVIDVNLASPTPPMIDAILDAFERYRLLLFRNQTITPEQQTRFAEHFAPTIPTHVTRPDDGLMFISNRERGSSPSDGVLPFHSDHSFFEEPDTSVLALYALAVPSVGGDTVWVDAMHAFDTLPSALKERLLGLHALHTYKRIDNRAFGAVQPLLRWLPDRQRAIIFVNQFCTHGIVEMQDAEADALLAEIFAHLYREETFYRHKWHVGDFIIWDNRVLQHARTDFDPSEERTLRRSTQGVPETVIEVTPQLISSGSGS